MLITFGTKALIGGTASSHIPPGYGECASEVLAFRVPSEYTLTLKNMRVHHNNPSISEPTTVDYVVYVNGSPSALQVQMKVNEQDGRDLDHEVEVEPDDLVEVIVTPTSTLGHTELRVIVSLLAF